MILPIILAGGSGSRLWPLSREKFPKQFQVLHGENSMLQETIKRLEDLECLPPLVVCNEEHRFIVAEQLREIGLLDHNIILEPVGRNTAPAIALAAIYAINKYDNPSMLVLAADHIILNNKSFCSKVIQAQEYVDKNKLVTFGIVPKSPETGYGYIKFGDSLEHEDSYVVEKFVEKPNLETAKSYLSKGEYLWNSGMFAFKAKCYIDELQAYNPEILSCCVDAIQNSDLDLDFIRVSKSNFESCPDQSIDYAVMEKSDSVVVVALDAGWSDVGAWSSLWEVSDKDSTGNVIRGDVINFEGSNNYIFAETGLVAIAGLDDIVVIQTKDAVLVASKNKAQDVKSIVNILKDSGRKETIAHREVYRPWGMYDLIGNGDRYQVKSIKVKPKERLSVQMHYHRAEHWIVVSGTAKVTVNGKETLLTENESIYIPLGSKHCLENPGKLDLEIIEVQVGSYLGEDDIVRFEDRYGRIIS